MTEGSLQELFQKLLKAEEIVKEREQRNTFSRGSTIATHEFRQKPIHRAPAQNTNDTLAQQNAQREDNRPRLLEPFRCGKKDHVAKSCHVVVNQIGVEQLNKGQYIEGKHVDCVQENSQGVTNNSVEGTHAWIRVLTVSNCICEAANTNVLSGSSYFPSLKKNVTGVYLIVWLGICHLIPNRLEQKDLFLEQLLW